MKWAKKQKECGWRPEMKVFSVPIGIVGKYMKEQELEIEDDLTQRELIKLLRLPDELKSVCFINGKRSNPDRRFGEGDVIKIVSTIAGG